MTAPRSATVAEVLTPSFTSLVSSVYSAVLYNLGELKLRGAAEVTVNIDLARFNLGLLETLRDKSAGNLTDDEALFLAETIANAKIFIQKHTTGPADAAHG
ncbi:MAG TPA: DUF1844 domain-containing protein [bacterium]|nr:DUF1844 domain-containing protein [bacterium]